MMRRPNASRFLSNQPEPAPTEKANHGIFSLASALKFALSPKDKDQPLIPNSNAAEAPAPQLYDPGPLHTPVTMDSLAEQSAKDLGTTPEALQAQPNLFATETEPSLLTAPPSDVQSSSEDTKTKVIAISDSKADDLMRIADALKASMAKEHEARMAEGPAARRIESGSPDSGYNTELTQGAEQAYKAKFGDNSDQDYDLRGAYAAGLTDGAKAVKNDQGGYFFPNHLPDTFKKPNHETFSKESQYAQYEPDKAGTWDGGRFIPPRGVQTSSENVKDNLKLLGFNSDTTSSNTPKETTQSGYGQTPTQSTTTSTSAPPAPKATSYAPAPTQSTTTLTAPSNAYQKPHDYSETAANSQTITNDEFGRPIAQYSYQLANANNRSSGNSNAQGDARNDYLNDLRRASGQYGYGGFQTYQSQRAQDTYDANKAAERQAAIDAKNKADYDAWQAKVLASQQAAAQALQEALYGGGSNPYRYVTPAPQTVQVTPGDNPAPTEQVSLAGQTGTTQDPSRITPTFAPRSPSDEVLPVQHYMVPPAPKYGLPSLTVPKISNVKFTSDERQKENVKPTDSNELEDFLGALKAYSYDYKNPDAPGQSPGRKVGVMAQDLEKSEIGKDAVMETPHGKMVDFGKLAPVTLAGLVVNHQKNQAQDLRLERLEELLAKTLHKKT